MWPRVVECMLGCWLAISPFIFATGGGWERAFELLVCGTAVIVLSLVSFWRPLGWTHFLVGPVAIWLFASGYFAAPRPGPPAAQNEIVVALLLLMLFLIPNEASEPPLSWRRFYSQKGN